MVDINDINDTKAQEILLKMDYGLPIEWAAAPTATPAEISFVILFLLHKQCKLQMQTQTDA